MGRNSTAGLVSPKCPVIWIAVLQHIRKVHEVKGIIHNTSPTGMSVRFSSVILGAHVLRSSRDEVNNGQGQRPYFSQLKSLGQHHV